MNATSEPARGGQFEGPGHARSIQPTSNPSLDDSSDRLSLPPPRFSDFVGGASCTAFGDSVLQSIDKSPNALPRDAVPGYFTHPSFNRLLHTSIALPDRSQAILLARRAHSHIGSNYHLFERRAFFVKLDAAYRSSAAADPLFACHLYAVMALGELYSNCKSSKLGAESIPGTEWYVQAVNLLEDLYETPTVEQIQVLLLLVSILDTKKATALMYKQSFYANALGRVKTAHVYCGIALRLSIGIGMHRSQINIDAVQQEVRRRVWWTLYLFDRLISSKLGLPLGIRDSDIDVENPSMEALTAEEQAEFNDPMHLCAHVRLARITGDILNEIYCLRPSATMGHHSTSSFVQHSSFARQVHRILHDLRNWENQLPAALRMSSDSTDRSLFTLHMQYHLCIIQTTRGILLHIFKTNMRPATIQSQRVAFPALVLALADACVQSAKMMNSLLSRLFEQGSLAVYGYFDAHYLFASTLILIIAEAIEPEPSSTDAVSMAFSLLTSMAASGNISAGDYLSRLRQIKTTMNSIGPSTAQHDLLQGSSAASDNITYGTGTGDRVQDPQDWPVPHSSLTTDGFLDLNPLENPCIESFLADEVLQGSIGAALEQDLSRDFANGLGHGFTLGN